ncbi:peptide-methionine (S)-S-oxide reductase MsrA [Pectinatus brassicae]|uniref:Peptide methionine sulfoxide reductase MsrA n=1 Tax=Pectinatus brassicae TaxID=862415 RepID=A0A840UEU9_9FIRM|nr:peptide-methionine (S)-S-oxide reductase MsrA [Pectinatus brassicae]MBB5335549.1 peptide-methionine (S)-S-oxide reductase/peptide methionine sulfoxide reductase msrA/msrB [Pectinatus brassicae]
MFIKTIYFSGGSFYELQKVFSRIKGVVNVTAGYINAGMTAPMYMQILNGNIDAVMGIKIEYNPKKIDLSTLLDVLFTVIDPYSEDKQGKCSGRMYRTGIYYCENEDLPIIQLYMNFIISKGKAPVITTANITVNDPSSGKTYRKCYVETKKLENFYAAEEIHQNYLHKNPTKKTFIDFARLKELSIIDN